MSALLEKMVDSSFRNEGISSWTREEVAGNLDPAAQT